MNQLIRRAHLDITGFCNLSCKHCHMSGFRKEQPSLEQITKTLDRLKGLGITRIALGGGEPLVRKDLFQILERCPSDISILTNGVLIDDQFLDKLEYFERTDNKSVTLRISLDGLQNHAKLRDYTGQIIFENIGKVRARGFTTVVNTMVSQFISSGELENLLDSLEGIKVDQWNLDLPYNEGEYRKNGLNPDLDRVLPYIRDAIKKYLSGEYDMRMDVVGIFCSELVKRGEPFPVCNLDSHPCNYQLRSMTINPRGEILLCPSLHYAFGDINEGGDILSYRSNPKWLDFMSHNRESPEGCEECKYIQICGGGCRANALSYTGNLWGRDQISCKLMEFMDKEIVLLYSEDIQTKFREIVDNS